MHMRWSLFYNICNSIHGRCRSCMADEDVKGWYRLASSSIWNSSDCSNILFQYFGHCCFSYIILIHGWLSCKIKLLTCYVVWVYVYVKNNIVLTLLRNKLYERTFSLKNNAFMYKGSFFCALRGVYDFNNSI